MLYIMICYIKIVNKLTYGKKKKIDTNKKSKTTLSCLIVGG